MSDAKWVSPRNPGMTATASSSNSHGDCATRAADSENKVIAASSMPSVCRYIDTRFIVPCRARSILS